jgi:hypothetical protein
LAALVAVFLRVAGVAFLAAAGFGLAAAALGFFVTLVARLVVAAAEALLRAVGLLVVFFFAITYRLRGDGQARRVR